MWARMWGPLPAALSLLALVAVAAAHAAPTSAIVGGLETSLLDGRLPGQDQDKQGRQESAQEAAEAAQPAAAGGRPTTARLERVYSGAIPARANTRPPAESYSRTGTRVHLTPAGTPSENPAPCAVAGRHFLHGQQVARPDPCEFCVCLDGEVFCWWQDCPPSKAQGPCRGRPAFSSCQDRQDDAATAPTKALLLEATGEQSSSPETDGDAALNDTAAATLPPAAAPSAAADATAPTRGQQTTRAAQDPTNNPQAAQAEASVPGATGVASEPAGTEAAPAASATDSSATAFTNATTAAAGPANSTTTSSPTTTTELMCHVLGSSYRVGEVLPRDTGSCLQCECSPAGRVTCSPKDCLSVREEEDVYQPASSLDMFDVDSF